jgi:hypothetical protein
MTRVVHFARAAAPLFCAAAALGPAPRASAQADAEPAYESRFVHVRGVRMHYLDFGGSGLPVIFIHGSHGNARS